MSGGRKAPPVEFCTSYHCPGDCGKRGHGYQHGGVINLAQQKHKRLTLAAFDVLERAERSAKTEAKVEVRRKAKEAL